MLEINEDDVVISQVLEATNALSKPAASPAVRRRASDLEIDLRQIAGTGRDGRITHGDIDTFLVYGCLKLRSHGVGGPYWSDRK